MKLFAVTVYGTKLNKKNMMIGGICTYILAKSRDEAYGIAHAKYKKEYTHDYNVLVVEVPEHEIAKAILQVDDVKEKVDESYTENIRLLERFATKKEYPWFIRGSTVINMSKDVSDYLNRMRLSAVRNYNYAAKLQTQKTELVKQIDEIKLSKLENERELERLRKQVEFLQESNKILENVNSSLREETKSLNKKLSEQDVAYRELEQINVNLNDAINNYEVVIQNREDEADANKRTVSETKKKLDKLKEDIFWLYGEACDIEGVKS